MTLYARGTAALILLIAVLLAFSLPASAGAQETATDSVSYANETTQTVYIASVIDAENPLFALATIEEINDAFVEETTSGEVLDSVILTGDALTTLGADSSRAFRVDVDGTIMIVTVAAKGQFVYMFVMAQLNDNLNTDEANAWIALVLEQGILAAPPEGFEPMDTGNSGFGF